jgi:hypothetical protein
MKHFEYSVKHHLVDSLNLIVFRNITEKIEMEAQLHKSDTLKTCLVSLLRGLPMKSAIQ